MVDLGPVAQDATASSPRRSRRRGLAIVVGVAVLVVAVLTGATWYGVSSSELAAARSSFTESRAVLAERAAEVSAIVERVGEDVATAEDLHANSADRTLDEAARETLANTVAKIGVELADARTAVTEASTTLAASESTERWGTAEYRAGRRAIDTAFVGLDRVAGLSTATALLPSAVAAVDAAIAARAARDALIASAYREHVWAAGWDPELDACQGSVDISAHYGVPAIAEHWSCTGKEFPRDAGAIVVFDGVVTGVFRVDGIAAMLDSSVNSVADLPRGHDLLYQTCIDGQPSTMAEVALTRIG